MSDASMRPVIVKLAAAMVGGVGVWTAAGSLAVTSPEGSRIGLLPPLWLLAGVTVLFAAFVVRTGRRGLALVALALPILAWLPVRIPNAFLIWTGPLLVVITLAAALGLGFQAIRRASAPWSRLAADPRRAPLLVAVLSLVLYGGAAWRVAPMIPAGDEPHYLIITQSLLYDRDLKIENNHTRGDYRSYVDIALRPDYIVRGTDGEIYSIHMPGLSALVAPAFLVGGYPGTVVFMILLAAASGALLWRLTFMLTDEAGAAWFGWASIALSVPIVFHSFTIYPDAAAVLPVLIGVLALLRASAPGSREDVSLSLWIGFGASLAILPWLHARFALVAGGLGLFVVLRLMRAPRMWRNVAAFLSLPLLSAVAWFAFFQVIYGSPNPRAQYGGLLDAISSPAFITSGIGGLLLDQQFGIVPRAPVFLCGVAGTLLMLLGSRTTAESAPTGRRRLALEILLLVTPYLVSTTTMRMWWGGWSAPARFVVSLIPLFAFGAAFVWQRARRRATRGVMLAALALSMASTLTFVWVDRGRLAYDIRQTDAQWLEWAGPLADLARGLPTFLRTPEPVAWLQSVVWLAGIVAAWILVRSCDGRIHTRLATALALVAAYAATAMVAITVGWRLNGSSGVRPLSAQVSLLRAVADDRGLGLSFDPLARLAAGEIPNRLTLGVKGRTGPDGKGEIAVPGPIPAGAYRVEAAGDFTVGIGRQFIPSWHATRSAGRGEEEPPPLHDTAVDLAFPIDVRAIVVKAGPAEITSITVRPRAIVPANQRPTSDVARQLARYAQTKMYFLDDGVFPEADAFWIRGARTARVVIEPERPTSTIEMFIRNAPVENTLTIEAGGWHDELKLGPGDERHVTIPSGRHGPTLVRFTTASGFRPSEVVSSSRDHRFLGVWIRPTD